MLKGLWRILPLAVLALSFCWSSRISGLKFLPLYEPLTIKAQKNSPPHIAFEEVLEFDRVKSEWAKIESIKPTELAVHKSSAPLFAKKVELPEMAFTKNVETIVASHSEEQVADNEGWIDQLSPVQAVRLQEAQKRSEVLDQDWRVPTWSEVAKEALDKSGALNLESPTHPRVYVAGVNSAGKMKTSIPQLRLPAYNSNSPHNSASAAKDTVQKHKQADGYPENMPAPEEIARDNEYSFVGNDSGRASTYYFIMGPLEITGGLAVTNEHHIEIRRSDEGILKELGKVDLKQGLYKIEVENTSGIVIARLVDKQGKILGEGSFRLSRLVAGEQKPLQGPKLKIAPQPEFAGVVTSMYNPRPVDTPPPQTRVTLVKGASEVEAKKDGQVTMNNVAKGSSTVMRAAAQKHLQSASIIISGQEFRTQLFPTTMIQALEDIVSEQRGIFYEGDSTVIWGKVALDGKALSGIDITVESDPGLQPIYFNQIMIPDPTLKATGENGLFAFVNVGSGFHSLLATRAGSIVGYQNVIVEKGSVALGNIEATIRTDAVPLRVFDAFSGEASKGTITMQSLQEDIDVQTGITTISLPHINRLGMLRMLPQSSAYAKAHYLYNDTDAFIHVPLIQLSWLQAIKNFLRIDDRPSVGIVVGFVPDEDFEVYLAGYDKFDPNLIVYFDMQGRILQNRKGMAGGGFILFNVPEDTHEIVVLGSRTEKIYSRVLPVDPGSISVLNFRE